MSLRRTINHLFGNWSSPLPFRRLFSSLNLSNLSSSSFLSNFLQLRFFPIALPSFPFRSLSRTYISSGSPLLYLYHFLFQSQKNDPFSLLPLFFSFFCTTTTSTYTSEPAFPSTSPLVFFSGLLDLSCLSFSFRFFFDNLPRPFESTLTLRLSLLLSSFPLKD
jgi:hypothetical protein